MFVKDVLSKVERNHCEVSVNILYSNDSTISVNRLWWKHASGCMVTIFIYYLPVEWDIFLCIMFKSYVLTYHMSWIKIHCNNFVNIRDSKFKSPLSCCWSGDCYILTNSLIWTKQCIWFLNSFVNISDLLQI